jgi:GT2 family glycosyltransferase
MKVTTIKREDRAPLVSIIIVNFNGGPLLLQAISAALASTASVELFISDNGSTDGSLNAVYQTFGKDPRVHIISNGSNLGFSRANNVALKQAKGSFMLLLNPDCIVKPNTIMDMVTAMESHSDTGMAGCLIRNPDGSEQAGCRRAVPTPWRSLVRVLHLNKFFPRQPRFRTFLLHQDPLPNEPEAVEAISGAFMMVRREAIDQVGLLDEAYFMHCEDIDWCMRFRQANWTILFVPAIEVVHHKGTCSKDHPIRVLFHMHRGMIRFYRKFFGQQYPSPLLIIVIPAAWARFLALSAKAIMLSPFRRGASLPIPPLIIHERRSPLPVITYIGPERRRSNPGSPPKVRETRPSKRQNLTTEKIQP